MFTSFELTPDTVVMADGEEESRQSLLGGQRRTGGSYTPGSVPDYGPIYHDKEQRSAKVDRAVSISDFRSLCQFSGLPVTSVTVVYTTYQLQ